MSPTSPDSSLPDVGVLIPAAGRGERIGGEPKQFRLIGGVPMLLRSVHAFTAESAVVEIVIALPESLVHDPPPWLTAMGGERVRLVTGGASRAESVQAALAGLSPASTIVLVHDAARPFVPTETIRRVIERARTGVGAVAAVPVSDTLKRATGPDGRVLETVRRDQLWRAQTPQGFPRAMLVAAYRAAVERNDLATATDESSLAEAAGFPVYLVPDQSTNIKITGNDDLVFAESLARS